jgi:hypothetical protein
MFSLCSNHIIFYAFIPNSDVDCVKSAQNDFYRNNLK